MLILFSVAKQPKKHLAVLTGDRNNEGFFYKKMYGRFARRPIESRRNNEVSDRIDEVAVRRGFTAQ